MLEGSVQWAIISLMLIVLVHYLYSFFLNTLTVPKVRDLVNKPASQYGAIAQASSLAPPPIPSTSLDQAEASSKGEDMEDELRTFLDTLRKQPATTAQTEMIGSLGYTTLEMS